MTLLSKYSMDIAADLSMERLRRWVGSSGGDWSSIWILSNGSKTHVIVKPQHAEAREIFKMVILTEGELYIPRRSSWYLIFCMS